MAVRRGQAWSQRIQCEYDGLPVNLTGYELLMHIKLNPTDPSPLLVLSTANGKILIADALNGQIDLFLSLTDTNALPVGSLYWDMVSGAEKTQMFGGRLLVEQGITL